MKLATTLTLLLCIVSCGKRSNSDTALRKQVTFQVTPYEFHRCVVIGRDSCGLTLNCGRWGTYFCVSPIEVSE
jgi:hypothetical protein